MARMLIQGLREQSLLEPADAVLTVRERAR
jgi:hypothetical protein